MEQKWQLPDEDEVKKITSNVERENRTNIKQKSKDRITSLLRAMKLSQEKGSSNWLNVVPLKEISFDRNKREFRDALHLSVIGLSRISQQCVHAETTVTQTMQ